MAPLINRSDEPVELLKIELPGRGLGRTVRVLKIEVSPNLGGERSIFSSAYHTDPPVARIEGSCHVPIIRPVAGTVIEPGATARVWVVLEWGEPGRFLLGPHVVYYRQGGRVWRQIVPFRYRGRVDAAAEPPRLDPWEWRCLSETTLLNPEPST